MDIKEVAKSMTRSEFLNTYGGYCPSKFELKNSENCEDEKWSCYNCLEEAVKDIKFKEDLEGEKVEDKAIKVRCINPYEEITIGKIYSVIVDAINGYAIKSDKNLVHIYSKDLFEKVEDVLMVECIDNKDDSLYLTVGKQYKAKEFNQENYVVTNDRLVECVYFKKFFKPVEPQKEYTLQEIFQEKEETKFKDSEGDLYIIRNSTMMKLYDEETRELLLNKRWFEKKFTKVEEPKSVSTAEAFKALEEFKTIISTVTANKYRKHLIGNYIMIYLNSNNNYVQREVMETRELEGQWIIESEGK